jgi:hypothetical protein
MHRNRLVSTLVVAAVVIGVAALASADYHTQMPAGGDKAQTQLNTAISHARVSAGSDALGSAVNHLGHVLNCIEGARGKNFNAAWGHVCEGQGDGILLDIKTAQKAASVMPVLEAADGLAIAGVKSKDLATVKVAARGVGSLLQVVVDGIK